MCVLVFAAALGAEFRRRRCSLTNFCAFYARVCSNCLRRAVVALFNAITKHQKTVVSTATGVAAASDAKGATAAGAPSGGGGEAGAPPSFLELLRRTTQAVNDGRALESSSVALPRLGHTAGAAAAAAAAPGRNAKGKGGASTAAAAAAPGAGGGGWSVLRDDYARGLKKGRGAAAAGFDDEEDGDEAPGLLDDSDDGSDA